MVSVSSLRRTSEPRLGPDDDINFVKTVNITSLNLLLFNAFKRQSKNIVQIKTGTSAGQTFAAVIFAILSLSL